MENNKTVENKTVLFGEKLFNIQQGMLSAELSKDKEVSAGARGRFKYLPLNKLIAAMAPLFKENKMIYGFDIRPKIYGYDVNGESLHNPVVKNFLIFRIQDTESFEKQEWQIELVNSSAQHDPAQAQGSGITYARRYLIEMALGLVGDVSLDPDENMNKKAVPKQVNKKPKQEVNTEFKPLNNNSSNAEEELNGLEEINLNDLDLDLEF